MRPLSFLALALVLGCGAASTARTGPEAGWSAHPPTQMLTCGAALAMCTDAASLRIRWPDGAHAPDGVHAAIDGTAIAPSEAELGICVAPGTHTLRVDGVAPQSVEILPGAESRVALSATGAEVTLGTIDVGAMVASLAHAELPTIAYDATPEERRVFAPTLEAAFDAWRARLARVTQIAETMDDPALRSACEDHAIRSSSIGVTIAEERPSADRLAAIRRAMEAQIEDAGTMVTVERSCPLYADEEGDRALAALTIEARPYVGPTTSVIRIRVAVDQVEALDTGAPHGELFEHTIADGMVPPGEHVITAEVTFADRGGARPRRPVLPTSRVMMSRSGTRVLIRALGDGTVEITTP